MPNDLGFLAGGGDMGALMRAKDWSQTPFGPLETWSSALRSAVGICLGSRFPMVLYWGPTRALIYNDAWSPVPGQKHPWALGRPGQEVWSEIWDIIGPMFDHVMNTGEATWSDDQLLPLHRFGYVEECYFYYSYSPVRGEDGQVEGIFTAVTETTYRVLAERRERLLREVSERTSQARSSEEACACVLEILSRLPVEAPFALVYLYDERTRRARRVGAFHLDVPEALGPAELDLSSSEGDTPWPLSQTLARGAAVSVALGPTRLAGRLPSTPWPEPVEEVLVTPIPGARAEVPHGFLVTGISARRRLDAAYRTLFERVADHLSKAIANIQAYELERQRAQQLAELDRAKTAFFSNASHEFRTPLTLMLGPLEDMLATAPPGAGARTLQIERYGLELVHRNGLRLLKLVNTLLDFSRLEAGRTRAVFEPVDLPLYTAELASTFRSAMERAGLVLVVDCPPLAAPVWVDRDMWEKIVLNLLSNAFKYTLQGQVTVRLQAVGPMVELSVRDTGVGIPPRELARVFERFHRIAGQQGRSHEGTGIGLALVQELARLHQGSARVESEEGRGSTFTVQVPLDSPHAGSSLTPSARLPSSTRAEAYVEEALGLLPAEASPSPLPGAARVHATAVGAPGERERLVLADDNADMRDYVRRLLSEAGYAVHTARDGVEALAAVREHSPALVLSDVMMPRLDGFGLLRMLRGDSATADLPIILLSARAGEEASVEGLEAGADDYLVKPFSARELLARVEGALRLARLRRETNESLRRANESLEARVEARTRELDRIWNVSQDHLLIANDQGVWLSVNPAWRRTLGWRDEDLVGRTSEWMEHPDDRGKTRAEVSQLAEGATTYRFENRFRDSKGAWHWFSWTAVPDQGLLYAVARDVTEDKARQAALEQAQEALRQSQKLEAVGKLTGGIAHDFNNLLTGISGSLELLRLRVSRGEYDRVERYVSTAIASTQRAAALTHRLLAFSRRQSLDLKSADLNALVKGMEDLLTRTLGERIKLQVRAGTGLWRVHTDAHQLENTLLNLCINARDAMPEGGALTIETDNAHLDAAFTRMHEGLAPGDYVVLSVTDTGTGIPPELRERIFEPFFTTKPIGQGTGLGLSMIYGFVKQSAGHLALESEVGRGTTFRVYLPRHQGEDDQEEAARSEAARGEGETVLVVEDDPAVRMLVVEVLGDLGYRALEAVNAESALPLLQSPRRIDLMVSDIGLPGMDGRRLAEQARQHRPKLRVLFITGYAEKAAVRGEFLGPGMDMITKPFALDALSHKIREILLGAKAS